MKKLIQEELKRYKSELTAARKQYGATLRGLREDFGRASGPRWETSSSAQNWIAERERVRSLKDFIDTLRLLEAHAAHVEHTKKP